MKTQEELHNEALAGTLLDRRTKAYKKWRCGCVASAENNQFFAHMRLEEENGKLKEQLNERQSNSNL